MSLAQVEEVAIGRLRASPPAQRIDHRVHGSRQEGNAGDDARFEHLRSISVPNLYNMHAGAGDRTRRTLRLQPHRQRPPGRFRRHRKEPPPINCVDCAPQLQAVTGVPTVVEMALVPVVDQMLAQVPIEIPGFHADNRSQCVSHTLERTVQAHAL